MKIKLRSRRGRICSLNTLHMGTCESMAKSEILPPKQVLTKYGILEGKRHQTKEGFSTDCFLGVPYARPPVGELRFTRPQPPEPWQGIKKCRRFGPRSVQNDMFWDKFTIMEPQSEDCLYLNIFAPAIDPAKKYPVLFYIHGGGWMMDSAVRYTPKNVSRLLVSRGIVVVTIQYRLGYLGWLCTGDEAAKGNYGLYDQLEALKWTKENIHLFGGDPNQITVGGQSAGAVSTDILSLSPLSRDMFNRKIVMGANSFCSWAVTSHEEISDFCRQKAKKIGWKPRREGYKNKLEENLDMVDFLRKVPASKLATHMIGCRPIFDEGRLPLAPVIDGDIIPDRLVKLRETAPTMHSIVGVGEQESLLFIALDGIRCNGKDMDKVLGILSKKAKQMGQKDILENLKQIYGDTDDVRHNKRELQKMVVTTLSDVVSNYACYRYMQHAQTTDKNCYAYSFDYTSKRMWGWLAPVIPFLAGTHASEIIYLFDCNYFTAPLPMNSTDRIVSEMTSKYIAEFVKTGTPKCNSGPGVEWNPIRRGGEKQMISLSDKPYMKTEIFDGRTAKLDEIMEEVMSSCKRDVNNLPVYPL